MKVKTIFKRYWKEKESIGHCDEEVFDEILDYWDLSVGCAMVNGESKTIEDFRKELYGNDIYITTILVNNKDNSFLIKDNLDREFYIQDVGMLEHTQELMDMPEYIEVSDTIENDEVPL